MNIHLQKNSKIENMLNLCKKYIRYQQISIRDYFINHKYLIIKISINLISIHQLFHSFRSLKSILQTIRQHPIYLVNHNSRTQETNLVRLERFQFWNSSNGGLAFWQQAKMHRSCTYATETADGPLCKHAAGCSGTRKPRTFACS